MAHNDSKIIRKEDFIEAVLWKLYLNTDASKDYKSIWDEIEGNRRLVDKIINSLTSTFRELLRYRLYPDSGDFFITRKELLKLWKSWDKKDLIGMCLSDLTKADAELSSDAIKKIRDVVSAALQSELSSDISLFPTNPPAPSYQFPEPPDDKHPVVERTIENDASNALRTLSPVDYEKADDTEVEILPTAQWQYKPVLHKDLDLHEESHAQAQLGVGGFRLIGARVRGKTHKHAGTNCDDWFEFSTSGRWNIIAVSDGAGSKKFSRVGAKVSCVAAVDYLSQSLQDIQLTEEILKDDIKRSGQGEFTNPDVEAVQTRLHEAMHVAYQAVEQAAKERQGTDYFKSVNPPSVAIENARDLSVLDLSATLLLVVQTVISYKEKNYSFILTCQVGDGLMASLSQVKGAVESKNLGVPDSGKYAGQTDFLTSKNKLEKENLVRKTSPHFTPLKVLMVMTDGVADDYFPEAPGIRRLYGDLLLNQVIEFPRVSEEVMLSALEDTNIHNLDGIREAKSNFQSMQTRLVPAEEKNRETLVTSFEKYAKELGKEESEVLSSNALLTAGLISSPKLHGEANNEEISPEERLRLWLDSYTVQGSFDDRTLVVLYLEE